MLSAPSSQVFAQERELSLVEIPIPSNVFSINNEAVAYRALGEKGQSKKVSISLDKLRGRTGGFSDVSVYAFDERGNH